MDLLNAILSGIMLGSIYSLVGLGFIVIYKASAVINFAQGQLLAVGALFMWVFLGPCGLPILLAGLLSVVSAAFLGLTVEYLAIRPMAGQNLMSVVMVTLAISTLLESLTPPIFGGQLRMYESTLPFSGLHFFGIMISSEYLLGFLVALGSLGFFLYFFRFTRRGLAMRAVADGHDTAASVGIKVSSAFRWSWSISAICAMVGGVLLGYIMGVSPDISHTGLTVFPVLILGGLTSIEGCIVAGPIVGILQMLAGQYLDPLTEGGSSEVLPSFIILATLLIRPYGIFGEKKIERV
jgi:branched-chain amino acid transport system permease protein